MKEHKTKEIYKPRQPFKYFSLNSELTNSINPQPTNPILALTIHTKGSPSPNKNK